ncbi:MAG TPA: hypothetical protein VNK52_12980 [Hyphomicrobiaceae bacterium]|nr:hypothetical protein [Hyphomicrobiaceae bacterium]
MMRVQSETAGASSTPMSAPWLGVAPEGQLPAATPPQRLEYLCELVAELKVMAEQGDLRRLAAILALAHDEARQQLEGR